MPIHAVLFPIVVFLIFYLRRRDVYDLHHAILGVLTSAIIDAVGRPQSDFFWRCFPDGKDIKALGSRCHIVRLCVVLLPLLVASLVGVSQVDDYWHH
ncbi:hypothetical protein BUALT_Bualt11G0061200 [Buddleja alternifolia]|uniref:Phosphatidic acid phosphatase type 2/haloperoxidase domain-containing protein n=1 Tax=Buddleja alternifolia TaxID=168488 RepID=A0AAV6X3Q7_9LAMI|nr:hypothetical protein BUALT_Bualt11G0061200 [Buddleja alternifolia]